MDGKRGKANILVVDDEENFRELLLFLLNSAGYAVRTSADGQGGLKAFLSWRTDLVVLDIVMPRMNGWELLERIRSLSKTPVIVLTCLGEEAQKVRALRGGADDYLAKPFGPAEFLARVESVLRRARGPAGIEELYKDPALDMDFERHRVRIRGREVQLSPLEFRLGL